MWRVFFFMSSSNWDINSERRPSGTCRSSARGERGGGAAATVSPADGAANLQNNHQLESRRETPLSKPPLVRYSRRFRVCNRFDVTSQAKPAGPGIIKLQRDFDSLGKKNKIKNQSQCCSPAAVQRAAAWTDGSFLQDDEEDSERTKEQLSLGDTRWKQVQVVRVGGRSTLTRRRTRDRTADLLLALLTSDLSAGRGNTRDLYLWHRSAYVCLNNRWLSFFFSLIGNRCCNLL